MKKKVLILLVGLLATAAVFVGCGESESNLVSGENSSHSASSTTLSSKNEEETSNVSSSVLTTGFKDNIYKDKDIQIEITDYKVIPAGSEGNEYNDKPVIAFWYKTTNISGKETDAILAWLGVFEAVQDNDPNVVNELDVASHPDETLLDNQMKKIKKGCTIENAVAYELNDTTTPVTLKATHLLKTIGTQTFELK